MVYHIKELCLNSPRYSSNLLPFCACCLARVVLSKQVLQFLCIGHPQKELIVDSERDALISVPESFPVYFSNSFNFDVIFLSLDTSKVQLCRSMSRSCHERLYRRYLPMYEMLVQLYSSKGRSDSTNLPLSFCAIGHTKSMSICLSPASESIIKPNWLAGVVRV